MYRILKIRKIEPFKVICDWDNGETRIIDFDSKLKEWTKNQDSIFTKLLEKNTFLKVKLDTESKTLYWEDLATMIDLDGKKIKAPLDLCPDVLYKMSKPIDVRKYHRKRALT